MKTKFSSTSDSNLCFKQQKILNKNSKFFSSNKKYVLEMLNIIDSKSNISIRVLDWFVSNYSKKKYTKYNIKVDDEIYLFVVNIEYSKYMKFYSKNYFDPFCRQAKVISTFRDADGDEIHFKTSIGQLNFFRWAIRNKVIMYVKNHLEEIEQDMRETARLLKEKKIEEPELAIPNLMQSSDMDIESGICSADKINRIVISSKTNKIAKQNKRQRLCKSALDRGIKINTSSELYFD
jgi:hypothetical protein